MNRLAKVQIAEQEVASRHTSSGSYSAIRKSMAHRRGAQRAQKLYASDVDSRPARCTLVSAAADSGTSFWPTVAKSIEYCRTKKGMHRLLKMRQKPLRMARKKVRLTNRRPPGWRRSKNSTMGSNEDDTVMFGVQQIVKSDFWWQTSCELVSTHSNKKLVYLILQPKDILPGEEGLCGWLNYSIAPDTQQLTGQASIPAGSSTSDSYKARLRRVSRNVD